MADYNANARISSVSREEFPADRVEIFDHIMETRKLTFMADLFGMMAHSPGALKAVASVGEHVRFHSVLDEVLREMVICTVSQEVGNFYEWCHHIHRMPDDMREAVGTPANGIRYLQFRDGPYWLKAGCDDPENFLGSFTSFDTPDERRAAVDYLATHGVNSMYVMTDNLGGDDYLFALENLFAQREVHRRRQININLHTFLTLRGKADERGHDGD